MTIQVVGAVGSGRTQLSAFDSALFHAGINLYNIIVLSSVIPLGTTIQRVKKFSSVYDERGYRLYVVMAERRSESLDEVIGAGIGWYEFKSGGGVFVEHDQSCGMVKRVKEKLEEKIITSVEDLCKIRGEVFEKKRIGIQLSISEPKDLPHCALSVAVYKAESW